MPLTDSAVRNAKPKLKLYRMADANGLCLEVAPTGSRLWRYRYRYNGKARMLALGAYPATSLANARSKRDEARELLSRGVDPSEQKKADKLEQGLGDTTFQALAEEWFKHIAPRWAESTRYKARLYLDNDILPAIGARSIKTVTRPELVELVRKVEARGTLNAAGKIRQWLQQIFRFGLAVGAVEANPATDLNIVAARPNAVRHHPHITFAEMPELLDRLEAVSIHTLTRNAIRLLILTAARPGELRSALWSEFDLDAATWTIPAARMKARRPHIVPLPEQAVVTLHQLHEITSGYPLVFPGQQNTDRPMSENTINKALRKMGYKDQQTGHGFRHLLSTELNGRGYNRDWIERQLAHGDKDEIRATYNHATYLEQRRQMMQDWADSIDALRFGGSVVSIKRA